MGSKLRNGGGLGGLSLLLVAFTTACGQLTPLSLPRLSSSASAPELDAAASDAAQTLPVSSVVVDQPAATKNGASASVGRLNATARLGSITDTLALTGRAAGHEETPITFGGAGSSKIESVPVKVGDKVDQGQVLLRTESQQVQRDLTTAKDRLETSQIRLEQARAQTQAQAQARQTDAARRAAADTAQRGAATRDAEAALHKAQADLERVQAGPASADVRAAETAVAQMQAALNRAQADEARLTRGADPADIRAAERDVANAQTEVDRAQADLDHLTAGPDPDQERAAQRDVDRAQNALRVVEAVKATDEASRAARDAAIANARLSLQEAQDRQTKLHQPPAARDVEIARRKLSVAQAAADGVRQRLDAVRKGPDQNAIDTAHDATTTAEANLATVQARLDELNSHPTRAELQAAQDKVTAAEAALRRAQSTTASQGPDTTSSVDVSGFDLRLLEKGVEQDQAQVQNLETELGATRLLAPFAGVVTAVNVRVGDAVDAGRPVLTLAKAGVPVIRVDVSDREASRLRVGQAASVQLDGSSQAPLSATLAALGDNPNGPGRMAEFTVTWSDQPPAFGRTATLSVTVQKKDNVVLVPKKAVHSAGPTQYVQFLDGGTRRVGNVQVGIVAGDDAEILSGVTEGQTIIVGP